jgi:hypothetical protein
MFHFWDEVGKLTLVAVMLIFSEVKIAIIELRRVLFQPKGSDLLGDYLRKL